MSDPKAVSIGFNLSDCAPWALGTLPAGCKGLVWIGAATLTNAVKNLINSCANQPQLWGFYIYDEPDPHSVGAAGLKAISDYCHATCPGCKTFIVIVDGGDGITPNYAPSSIYLNTGIDYFGIDQYPVQIHIQDSQIEATITNYINNALAAGFPLAKLVPVVQCSGGDGVMIMPTASQMTRMFSAWDAGIPSPAFEYTYEWGLNSGETASLMTASAAVQAVYQQRYSAVAPPPPPPPPPPAEAFFTGTSAPAASLGNVGDVYAQVATSVSQGAPQVTVPPPVVTTTTTFWKKGSSGWVAQ
ncbi:hypothetical protein [Bradyrhizobium lablabi]|uniref:hypothetical protein n=1 Tax=Bradyrhizobium lablabi TaxID=722472 RepID=UPI001BA76C24|nr:hypothetical protein [Bradyrhizobium lablabi]MBR0693667.1 hypothetical protein [Bradyrhizobium lablabi]